MVDVIRLNNESIICVLMIYVHDHMTNTKSHTVGTAPKYNRKT